MKTFYRGTGTVSEFKDHLPTYPELKRFHDPRGYRAEDGLRHAVNVALLLGQPLLVTGEPGTGKTQLAGSVAYELDLPRLTFSTKSTSTARDLFYRYDALSHFRAARADGAGAQPLAAEPYITYEALGLAIILSNPQALRSELRRRLLEDEDLVRQHPEAHQHLRNGTATRSVVLIDEIDKAPRDLPNDVLNEIEYLEFTVRETGQRFAASPESRPILILTSNSEKNLPDAFLRRCVFYHINFPPLERLESIVRSRLELRSGFTTSMLDNALRHFEKIRSLPQLKKAPATAELLAWLRLLEDHLIDVTDPAQAEALARSYCILAKSREDYKVLQEQL